MTKANVQRDTLVLECTSENEKGKVYQVYVGTRKTKKMITKRKRQQANMSKENKKLIFAGNQSIQNQAKNALKVVEIAMKQKLHYKTARTNPNHQYKVHLKQMIEIAHFIKGELHPWPIL